MSKVDAFKWSTTPRCPPSVPTLQLDETIWQVSTITPSARDAGSQLLSGLLKSQRLYETVAIAVPVGALKVQVAADVAVESGTARMSRT
jgi:hypothetical protein